MNEHPAKTPPEEIRHMTSEERSNSCVIEALLASPKVLQDYVKELEEHRDKLFLQIDGAVKGLVCAVTHHNGHRTGYKSFQVMVAGDAKEFGPEKTPVLILAVDKEMVNLQGTPCEKLEKENIKV